MTAATKTIRLSVSTLKAVRSLAVEYASYRTACDANDDLGILVWGKMLLDTQRTLDGVGLADPALVEAMVAGARRRTDAAKLEAA